MRHTSPTGRRDSEVQPSRTPDTELLIADFILTRALDVRTMNSGVTGRARVIPAYALDLALYGRRYRQ